MHIAIGSDHAGYPLKEHLAQWLREAGHTVQDCGTTSTDSVDYPLFAGQVAQAVRQGRASRGVLVCGSGIGMAMAANRCVGVRAAVIRSTQDAQLSREHNDANVACFGGRITATDDAVQLLDVWLHTDFAGGRHQRRIEQMDSQKGPVS